MSIDFHQVDAFAQRPFTGNPAAVCILARFPADGLLQEIAQEMNLSETAFLVPGDRGAYHLRWFTPVSEVDLCGHATLASAHVLFETGVVGTDDTARFETRSGTLTVRSVGEGLLEMDFPAEPAVQSEAPGNLSAILGAHAVWFGGNRMDYLAELSSERAVRELEPDLQAVALLGNRGLIVTAQAGEASPYDFVSRFFAPQLGVPEDPVTGSAHCALAPFWAKRLGQSRLSGWQASLRGGLVGVQLKSDRVRLTGKAVTVITGTIHLDPTSPE